MENLDQLFSDYGYKFAEEITEKFKKDRDQDKAADKAENLLTKALGVLQEQGLYAFALFCESRGSSEKDGAKMINVLTIEMLKKLNLLDNGDLLREIRKDNGLGSKLEDLTLAVQLLEKSLIYARYHAKAKSITSK